MAPMATILEQSNIDKLIELQEEINRKLELAQTAREKLEVIHMSVYGYPYLLQLESLEQIGKYIDAVSAAIKTDNKYYDDFKRLQSSYRVKLFS